jgi:NADH-quinone oxidoreductase subunit J
MSTGQVISLSLIVLFGAVGNYLLLPHRHGKAKTRTVYTVGATLAGLGLMGILTLLSVPSDWLGGLFFYIFAIGAIGGGILSVTSRDPVYSALWFAAVVISSAGLFALAGASFLAAGTIIVYAGAIIVTFLFVIMLAQAEGRADYDRTARSPGIAAFTSFLLFWCLLSVLVPLAVRKPGEARSIDRPEAPIPASRMIAELQLTDTLAVTRTLQQSQPATNLLKMPNPAKLPDTTATTDDASKKDLPDLVDKPNVAGLGEALYTNYLLTVELAGSLLFVALIAAIAITNPKRHAASRPGINPTAKS